MSMELRELYQEIIIDHNRNPRNHHAMEDATTEAKGFNPLCGDKLTVYLKLQSDLIRDVSFVGCGCAISQASASLMTDALKGKSIKEAHELFHRVHRMLTQEEEDSLVSMDKLTVLAGVKAFPARVKCATLAWHTLEAALNKETEVVKTE
ncbi:TPA: SUF system NifU family Fe-S cluster assembly protein [Legionella pneumophila]|uniref:Fe-S cluster assembly sulfur transfer protein SufU n=1 Tax=Legionella sp. PATHC039 TaxID=2992042 RepID=UPI0007782D2F|nr:MULTISPECIES: SUF system NifU family Fe-S cluster assembly protein [Legionella]HAT8860132.1 SUF system NifU family Fe-S cluster assembly protein [Legionella pneumophila subsp. pneumophila]MCW8395772.1 SUF system NifU family Fe-S cluster assembly protein [Legionella sp. PATHC039]HAT7072569.1 SUF system NifU family Fe-S cluster assembly protein [Legionella pneumophila]HAT8642208.1 SUF system NifU family Fe-S cluster assembly protein [Legionella pneumophila]HAT8868636.1 SUF system NifU family 